MPSVFNLSIPQLGQWSRRQKVDHRQQNEPVEAINRMITGVGIPHMKDAPLASAATVAVRVILAEAGGDFPDHLVCRALTSDHVEYTPILVAKPWLLRQTPFDGETRGQVRYVYDPTDSTKRTAYDTADLPDLPEDRKNKRTELVSPFYLPDRLQEMLPVQGDELLVLPVDPPVTVTIDVEGQPVEVSLGLIDASGMRGWTVFFGQL